MLPAILGPVSRSVALLNFSVRASIAKAAILIVLFYVARHFGSELGRNLSGLMLGFSVYLGVSIANLGIAKASSQAIYGKWFWSITPLASFLCILVWTVALWEFAPVADKRGTLTPDGRDSEAVALELARFNDELSKFLHK
jgi:hypothetical protein